MDSELIAKIKQSGLLDETDIKEENGVVITKGSCGVNRPAIRGFNYYWAFITKQNSITLNNLEDGHQIQFLTSKADLPEFNYESNILNINNNDEESEEDYPLYYKDFLDNNMSIGNLAYQNEVILKCNKIKLMFDYPNRAKTMLQITADDEMKGFTVGELALKIMQRYHMLYYMNYNYDVKTGKVIDEKHTFEWNRPYVQPPIPDGSNNGLDFLDREFKAPVKNPEAFEHCFGEPCFEYEWSDNGVKRIEYNKQMDYWKVICIDYI